MLSIKRVKFKNYCQHKDLDLEFGTGVIGIVGSNGSGKSNLMKGILRALTGDVSHSGKKEDDLSWGEKSGSIEIWFTVNGSEGYIKRDLNSSRCALKIGDVEYKSYKEVSNVLYPTLGVAPKVLTDIVFVMQGQIEGILFQPPGDRARALQHLFGTQNAEQLRELLYDEITNLPVTSYAEAIAQLENKLNTEIELPLNEARDTVKLCSAWQISPEEYRQVCQQIIDYAAYADRIKTLPGMKSELARVDTACTTAENQLRALHASAAALESSLADTEAMGDEARTVVDTFNTQGRMTAEKDLAAAAVLDSQAVLSGSIPPPPFPRELLETAHHSLSARKTEYAQLSGILDMLASGTSATCPTCGQDVKDIGAKKQQLASMAASMGQQDAKVSKMDEQFTSWLEVSSNLQHAQAAAQVKLKQAEAQLVALAKIKTVSKADADAAALFVNMRNTQQLQLSGLRGNISGLEVSLPNQRAACETLRTQYTEISGAIGRLVPESAVAGLIAKRKKHEDAQLAIGRAEGIISALQPQHDCAVKQIDEYKERQRQASGLLKWRDMLERARKILHRDELPNMVAQAYLRVLNQRMAKYLELFGAKYSATLAADTSVSCVFPGAPPTSGDRLSGGQKTVLGVAFRLAVYDILGSGLGVLAMDEPTAALDSDSVTSLMSVLEHLRSYVKGAGLQIFIVTHAHHLTGSFDQTVAL
jgi:DNA repair exonuclease SbcCD ATPase subunit